MSRSERLLDLLQSLRRRTRAVRAQDLAGELGVNIRTIYRDIVTLQGQGAPIEGEAGIGYLLRPGFTLPPLMFTKEELEALVLGARWTATRGDAALTLASRNALAKIGAVLTPVLKEELETTTVLVSAARTSRENRPLSQIRAAIRSGRKLTLDYTDQEGAASKRTIWPFALGFLDQAQVVVAWCELREDFRTFRLERIQTFSTGGEAPEPQRALFLRWLEEKQIPASAFELG